MGREGKSVRHIFFFLNKIRLALLRRGTIWNQYNTHTHFHPDIIKCRLPKKLPSLRSWVNKGHTNVEKTCRENTTPRADPGQFHHKLLPRTKFIFESPRRACCRTVKDGFSKNKLAGGESWNRSTLFDAFTALRSHNSRQDETNACNYWAIWIASFKAGEERKQAWLLLQPLGSSGQTLWQVCNCGNEERWSHSMKGHCFGLKCMNSCCYYAWFFGFAGARRFFSKAYSLAQYINICKVAREACQNHRELWH